MKKITSILMLALVLFVQGAFAQTADEVVNKYLAAVGGADKWKSITSSKMEGTVKTQGLELPFAQVGMVPNFQKITATFQGKELVQQAFDGVDAWGTNFMTMKAEKKSSEESYNMADEAAFLDPFIDYASRGYKIALEGSETIEGVDCHKVKLTRKPVKVDGKEEENFGFYYFDKETGVMIASKSTIKMGPGKGTVVEGFMSNYQEVNGVFVPFEITQKVNGETQATLLFTKVVFNEKIDTSVFKYTE